MNVVVVVWALLVVVNEKKRLPRVRYDLGVPSKIIANGRNFQLKQSRNLDPLPTIPRTLYSETLRPLNRHPREDAKLLWKATRAKETENAKIQNRYGISVCLGTYSRRFFTCKIPVCVVKTNDPAMGVDRSRVLSINSKACRGKGSAMEINK